MRWAFVGLGFLMGKAHKSSVGYLCIFSGFGYYSIYFAREIFNFYIFYLIFIQIRDRILL